jgi:hypothetical protein
MIFVYLNCKFFWFWFLPKMSNNKYLQRANIGPQEVHHAMTRPVTRATRVNIAQAILLTAKM